MPPDSRLVSRAPRRSRCSPCFIHGPPGGFALFGHDSRIAVCCGSFRCSGGGSIAPAGVSSCGTSTTAVRRMILFRHPASLLRRTEPLRTALMAAAFWTLAVIALTSLRYFYLGGMPQVEVVVVRATMVCCVLLFGLVGAPCVMAWRKSGSIAPVWNTVGGKSGMLLFAAVASYLVIGASVLGVEAIREPDTAGLLKYQILHLGVLAAAAVGGRAMLERTGRAVVARLARGADGGLRRHSRFTGPCAIWASCSTTGFRFAGTALSSIPTMPAWPPA